MQWLKDRSWVNKYIFPVPKPPRYTLQSFPNHMLFIPSTKDIPYSLAANFFRVNSDKIVIFSHGNYEDLGENFDDIQKYSAALQLNFLVYDYSGYGINAGTPNESTFNADIRRVYEYPKLHFETKNIILFGRSLGNGPTMDLAAELTKKNISIGGVILLSPFTTICDLIGEAFTQIGSYLMVDRFNNRKMVKTYTGPLFIIHGQKDELINPSQSQQLYEASKSTIKFAHFPHEMTHNSFDPEEHIITPVAWFLSKIYPGQRVPIGKFVQISLVVGNTTQSPSLLKASRGFSAAVMDSALNKIGKKSPTTDFCTSQLLTREGVLRYVTDRLVLFSQVLKEKYIAARSSGELGDEFPFVYDTFVTYEPFMNIYVEMTKLRVQLPPGAAILAKSVHMMQSAPVGLLHAQLCIGGLVYSWDQTADCEGKEINFSHVTDTKQTVRIPVRIFHVRKRWAGLMLSWLNLQGDEVIGPIHVAAIIANEFVDCYYDMLPDVTPLQSLVQTWNSTHHYQAATQNCQDFVSQALAALKLTHFATPNLFYSEPLVTYMTNVHADPSFFAPTLYGNTESEFVATWQDPTAHAHGSDYALMAAKHFLRNGGYTSPELIRIHAKLVQVLVQKYKDIQSNTSFVVFCISKS